jgi:hypothetical protein
MYTSMLLVALSGLPVAADAEGSLKWQTSYTEAKKQCLADQKPIAVFIGSGKSGWNQLSRDGKLGKEIDQVLMEKYVPLYIDSSTPEGKRLATVLGINDPVGIVISDSKCEMMAFYHEGDLAKDSLSTYLARYSDPNRVVQFTDSNPGHHKAAAYAPAGGCVGGCCNGRCR